MIKPADMLRQMRQRRGPSGSVFFSLLYCTADRRRKTGGQIRSLRRASLLNIDGPQILVQPYATKEVVCISTDLILEFNDQPLS